MRDKFRGFFYCLLLMCLPVLLSAQKKNVMFKDITSKAGIDFKYTFGDYSYENILESSGSGITVFDYNNDGLMDLYLMNGTYLEGVSDPEGKVFKDTGNKLYKNNGNGTFTDVSVSAGINQVIDPSFCATFFDYDNDGWQDINEPEGNSVRDDLVRPNSGALETLL